MSVDELFAVCWSNRFPGLAACLIQDITLMCLWKRSRLVDGGDCEAHLKTSSRKTLTKVNNWMM